MAKWNKSKRVLEHEHTKFWCHELVDVSEPNLQRDVFPYQEICRIDFDHKIIAIDPAEEMFITDTTFRDGQQARPPYTVEQVCAIFDLLHRLGGPNGLIRQTEFFLYSEKDKEAVQRCMEKGYRYPEITGWTRARAEDLKLVKQMGLKETGILTSVSDYHIFFKLNKKRSEAMKGYLRIVESALEHGIIPRCHFEDVTRADIYGFCVPFAIELMKLREKSGIDIKIRLCDTLGYGVTYPGTALPRSVPKLVRAMIDDAGVPGQSLEWHGHNDFHKVLVNAATAWLYGCAGVNGTLLGFGERTGNAPIEGLVIEYINLVGQSNGVDTTVITDIAEYFEKELAYHIPANYPFIGSDFNATRAGVHADGLIKNEEIYNIFDTGKLLKRPVSIVIGDKSGTAGITHWINNRLCLAEDTRVDKRHPGIAAIYKWVMEQYEDGRVTAISNEEMGMLARKHLPELFISEFDKLKRKAADLAAHLIEEIAEREEIKTMRAKTQEPVLRKFLAANPFIQFIYITNTEGRKTTKNVTHVKDRAKYENYKLDRDFSDRPWFINPLQDGKVHVTDFYTSKITGALCITVSAPVRNDDEEIVGVLGSDIRFEDLAKMEKEEDI
ncbi:MAG: cache domain-containing protein [Pseudomonadota bacterium]